jgi:hypothetical protein
MKKISLLVVGGLALASLGSAQSTFTFKPKYKAGQTETYVITTSMGGKGAAGSMNMSMTRKVLRIMKNGDMEMEVSTSAPNIGGNSMGKGSKMKITTDAYGQPKGGAASGMDFSATNAFPKRPIKIGEVIPFKTKTVQGETEGTIKLVSIAGGIARFSLSSTIKQQSMSMKMNGTMIMTTNSVLKSMDADVTGGPMGPIHVRMELKS